LGFSSHLIVNPAAGSAAALRESLTGAAHERGIRVRVLEPGQDMRLTALAAVEDGAQSLAVAGGDGSVAAVAGVAAERDLPLVVVPTGTLNHFARDLGLDPAHPLSALDTFYAAHEERRVDVGRIPKKRWFGASRATLCPHKRPWIEFFNRLGSSPKIARVDAGSLG